MKLPSKIRMHFSFITYIIVLLTLPMLLGADDQKSDNFTVDNRKRIEQMTQSERNHLKRNFVAYQELEPHDREYYRNFHFKLVEDAEDRPLNNMNDTLNDYIEWLNRINPYDRQKLREEKDVLKRLKLVREILFRQERELRSFKLRILQQMQSMQLERGPKNNKDMIRMRLGGKYALSSNDIKNVTRVLEKSFPLQEDQQKKLKTLKGSARQAFLLALTLRYAQKHSDVLKNETFFNDLKNAVSDPVINKEYFSKREADEIELRKKLFPLLFRSVYIEDITQKLNENPTTPAELAEFKKHHIHPPDQKNPQAIHPYIIDMISVRFPDYQAEIIPWIYALQEYGRSSVFHSANLRQTIIQTVPESQYKPIPGMGKGHGKGGPGPGGRNGKRPRDSESFKKGMNGIGKKQRFEEMRKKRAEEERRKKDIK